MTTGERVVTSTGRSYYEVTDGKRYQVDHPEPFTLTPRESHSVYQNVGKLAYGMKKAGVSGLLRMQAVAKEKTVKEWKNVPGEAHHLR